HAARIHDLPRLFNRSPAYRTGVRPSLYAVARWTLRLLRFGEQLLLNLLQLSDGVRRQLPASGKHHSKIDATAIRFSYRQRTHRLRWKVVNFREQLPKVRGVPSVCGTPQ